ncbi:MAG TPA: universal stress protein, partial [Pseudolabrys sp.]|nr:universal stress protein [Pseudolabrys sp.]
MIKDLIVNLGLGDRDPAGDYAISIAQAYDAHVLGVALAYEPVIPGSVMGGIPPEFLETQRTESERSARKAMSRFEDAAKRAGVAYETRLMSSSVSGAADQVGRLSRRFDLAVVGQPRRDEGMPDEVLDEGVLFDSGRPVLFVPYIQKDGLKLDHVMV